MAGKSLSQGVGPGMHYLRQPTGFLIAKSHRYIYPVLLFGCLNFKIHLITRLKEQQMLTNWWEYHENYLKIVKFMYINDFSRKKKSVTPVEKFNSGKLRTQERSLWKYTVHFFFRKSEVPIEKKKCVWKPRIKTENIFEMDFKIVCIAREERLFFFLVVK